MTVKKIVKNFLDANGYDGLFNECGECGCLKSDLAPCGELSGECEAGYKSPSDSEDYDWMIWKEKQVCGQCGCVLTPTDTAYWGNPPLCMSCGDSLKGS